MKYRAELARHIERDGGHIYRGSHVAEFEQKPRRPQVNTSDKHTVTANAMVFATNSPVNDWVTMHTKQAAYRTYVIGVRVPNGSVPRGRYWDNLDLYHYVRLAKGEDATQEVPIVGGQDHKTGRSRLLVLT